MGAPARLFSITDLERDRDERWNSYDVAPDGAPFLVVKRIEKPASQLLHVILNWRPNLTVPPK